MNSKAHIKNVTANLVIDDDGNMGHVQLELSKDDCEYLFIHNGIITLDTIDNERYAFISIHQQNFTAVSRKHSFNELTALLIASIQISFREYTVH